MANCLGKLMAWAFMFVACWLPLAAELFYRGYMVPTFEIPQSPRDTEGGVGLSITVGLLVVYAVALLVATHNDGSKKGAE